MSLRSDLGGTLARDPRYSIHAYDFIFEVIEFTKTLRNQTRTRSKGRERRSLPPHHVTGRDLCEGARRLALEQYGLMALAVLKLWGIRSTSDLGEIVYHLIALGDFEKTPKDSRSDFDDVFDFQTAFERDFMLTLDEIA